MKFQFSKPNPTQLKAFLQQQEKDNFSYPEIGATQQTSVAGYDNDDAHVLLGEGDAVWYAAKKALQDWQHFPFAWTKIHTTSTPPQKGQTVIVLFRLFGLWWLNSTRLVYTFDEPNRYGFAYGTLNEHVERGEEVFWIEKNKAGQVFYHIKAFSRPNWWGVKLAYPLARHFQRRFRRDSSLQMKKLCH